MTTSNVILVFTTTCTALIAGLFYSYSYSVVPGLKSVNDSTYIASMQSINRAIQNPVFFAGFFGALILLPVSAYMNYSQHPSLRFWLLLTAAIIYLTGVIGVTVVGNIPLNNALEKFNLLNASKDAINLQRTLFERPWNNLNTVRTISSILSLVLVIIACINSGKSDLEFSK